MTRGERVSGMFEAIHWPNDMAPSRCPIHFTNEREVEASIEQAPDGFWRTHETLLESLARVAVDRERV